MFRESVEKTTPGPLKNGKCCATNHQVVLRIGHVWSYGKACSRTCICAKKRSLGIDYGLDFLVLIMAFFWIVFGTDFFDFFRYWLRPLQNQYQILILKVPKSIRIDCNQSTMLRVYLAHKITALWKNLFAILGHDPSLWQFREIICEVWLIAARVSPTQSNIACVACWELSFPALRINTDTNGPRLKRSH